MFQFFASLLSTEQTQILTLKLTFFLIQVALLRERQRSLVRI